MTKHEVAKSSPEEVALTEQTHGGRAYSPLVDIVEIPEELQVLAEMPGVTGEDIHVHFENGILNIYGRVAERHPEEANYLLREYAVGDFSRSFRISEGIDTERISARYSNGILTLHLPKTEAIKPRRISVKVQ